MTFTPAEAKTDKTYVTRAAVLRQVEKILGASVQSADMSSVKDVTKKDSCYKTMAIALQAGLVKPNAKTGKLYPNKKATWGYLAGVVSKVLEVNKAEVLGLQNANQKLTKTNLTAALNRLFPNVLTSSATNVKKGNAVIKKAGVTLKDTAVAANLVIGDGVGSQVVTLDNVSIKDKLIIRSGHVILKGKTKYATVIVVGEGTRVDLVGATVGKLTVKDTAKNAVISVDADSSVDQVELNAEGARIIGAGKAGTVYVNANGTEVTVTADKIQVKDGVEAPKTKEETTSNSGSTGGSSSGNSGSTEKEPEININSVFEEGYPKVTTAAAIDNEEKIQIKVTYKLKKGNATAKYPVEIYNIVATDDSTAKENKVNVTSVLHGHAGNDETAPVPADDYGYLKISDDQEHAECYDYTVGNTTQSKIVYSVVRRGDKTSSIVTAGAVEVKESGDGSSYASGTSGFDTAPKLTRAVVNSARNKVYLYFDQLLNTDSTPATTCFTITGSAVTNNNEMTNETTSCEVKSVSVTNCAIMTGRVDLEISAQLPNGELSVGYTQPTNGPGLTGKNNQKVETIKNKIETIEDGSEKELAYISSDGQYMVAGFRRPLLHPNTIDQNLVVTATGSSVNGTTYRTEKEGVEVILPDAYTVNVSIWNLNLTGAKDIAVTAKMESGSEVATLCDLAGDTLTIPALTTIKTATESAIESVSYCKEAGILMSVSNTLEDDQDIKTPKLGCGFVLRVDGTEYTIRGCMEYESGESKYLISNEQLGHIDLEHASKIQIKGVKIPTSEYNTFAFTSLASQPLETDWVDVKIERL